MLTAADRRHARVVANRWLILLTPCVRVLLAVGFLGSGLVKMLGSRFTLLPVTDPVGYLFDALYQAQIYYRFLGTMQVAAALMLLVPATATLGALLYLPIILNIFFITLSVGGFSGTRIVTGMMLLADLYLLAWDYDRWKALLPGGVSRAAIRERHGSLLITLGLFVSALLGFRGITSLHLARLRDGSFVPGAAMLAVGVMILAWVVRRSVRS